MTKEQFAITLMSSMGEASKATISASLAGFDGTDLLIHLHHFSVDAGGSLENVLGGEAGLLHQFEFKGLFAVPVEGSTGISTEADLDALCHALLQVLVVVFQAALCLLHSPAGIPEGTPLTTRLWAGMMVGIR